MILIEYMIKANLILQRLSTVRVQGRAGCAGETELGTYRGW